MLDNDYLIKGEMYQYNLGWLIQELMSFKQDLATAIDLKTIKYADPIQWDITTQYPANTVVVDPKSGTAYMSKVPVPAGVELTNSSYWVVVFNYQDIYNRIMDGVAFNDRDQDYATKDLLVNDLVWYAGDLYRVTRAIPTGSKYIPGTNLIKTSIESLLARYYGRDRTAQVSNDTVNVSGDYTLVAGDIAETSTNRTIKVTKDREIDVDGSDSVHIDGVSTVNVGGLRTEVYAGDKTEKVTGTATEEYTETHTENHTGKKIVNAEDIVLNPTEPLTYGTPTVLTEAFKIVPMKSNDGTPYNVLVENSGTSKLGYSNSQSAREIITSIIAEKVFRASDKYIYPQGCDYAENNKYIISLISNTGNDVNLICLDISNYTIDWNIIVPADHANSVVFNPVDRKIYIAACFKAEDPDTLVPTIYVIDYDRPTEGIIQTITVPNVTGIYSIALDKDSNKWYSINYRGTEIGKYNRVYVYNGTFESIEKTIDLKNYPTVNGVHPSWQGITAVKDGLIYGLIYSPVPAVCAWDFSGDLIVSANVNRFSNGYKPVSEVESLFYNADTDTFCMMASNLLISDEKENSHGATLLETNINRSILTYAYPYIGTGATRLSALKVDHGLSTWKPATQENLKSIYDAISIIKNSFYQNAVIYVKDSSKTDNVAIINDGDFYGIDCIISPDTGASKIVFNGLIIAFSNIIILSGEYGGTRTDNNLKVNVSIRDSIVQLNGELLNVDGNQYGILSYQNSVVYHNTANDTLSYPIALAVNTGSVIDTNRDGMYTNKYIKYDNTVPMQKSEVYLGVLTVGNTVNLKTNINNGYLFNKISVNYNGIFNSALLTTTASIFTQEFGYVTTYNNRKTLVWLNITINVSTNTITLNSATALSWNESTNTFESVKIPNFVLRIWLERV